MEGSARENARPPAMKHPLRPKKADARRAGWSTVGPLPLAGLLLIVLTLGHAASRLDSIEVGHAIDRSAESALSFGRCAFDVITDPGRLVRGLTGRPLATSAPE